MVASLSIAQAVLEASLLVQVVVLVSKDLGYEGSIEAGSAR